MKLISWNVNGLRANIKKGFIPSVRELQPDILCLQETKMEQGQAEVDLPEYYEYWNSAEKKGYSGTAIFTKEKPLSSSLGMGIDQHDREGRIITLEYRDFYLVNVYTPNSKDGLLRLPYRMQWEDDFKTYVKTLENQKPVIICGDLNVAHKEIDLKNPKTNQKNPGFTIEERNKLTALLESGFTDTFRYFYPDTTGAYSWWSYRGRARENNTGWRIDYFLASNALMPHVTQAAIYPHVLGSDHCPVGIDISC
ncbi:MAG: exodeoxyribonuclease III [Clostridiales bacterium]|nr:exodeoxyribonuclease III [Clostridiales bacterium]